MKTELTYLEARITALAAYVQELRKDHSALQHALVEKTESHLSERREHNQLRAECETLQTENKKLKSEVEELQTLINESIQEVKSIINMLPEVPNQQESPPREEAL